MNTTGSSPITSILIRSTFVLGLLTANTRADETPAPAEILANETVSAPWKFRIDAGLSAPQPVQVGIQAYTRDDLRWFAQLGFFTFAAGERGATIYGLQGGFRWFPGTAGGDHGFYTSTAMGYQHGRVSAVLSALKIEDETVADAAVIRFSSIFISPAVGYVFRLSEKVTLACEIGVQIPLLSFGDLYLKNDANGQNSDNSDLLKVDSRNYISRLSSIPLPQITFFRLSWAL